ncbi:phosphomevalonate kinase [Sulfurisphaera ohwakuensis]|uniref:phosphomevalonate kinase n=1 Tax=Sulfurisphaera ohwakuensis TaxID=69656 RepID=A0A650CGL9_SULOH|nr:phosphomevalonate kinase [Sulfurisphaera ohwakuensis]MBB5254244.1 phosphomevalonate kinase [Sulfurisphaera ohwakuensis]QGR16835.1 GHMP kinase [Sulfurisphaera ohwakuensis]
MISAPGKILWIGSYSVVFGGISHVIAINRRVRCDIKSSDNFIFETTYGTFKDRGNELIESVITVFKEKFGNLPPFHVKLFNDEDFQIHGKKTGLGSSSASTVALTSCIYYHLFNNLNKDEIYKLAQKANYIRQKGIGSGFDIASAVYGSIVYRRFYDIEKIDSIIEPLKIGNYEMLLGFIGESFSTVNSVAKFIEKSNNEEFKKVMKYIDEENIMAIKLIKLGKIEEAIEHVKLARRFLNGLAKKIVGVEIENEKIRRLIEIAENDALIALSPGAGGESVFALGKDLSKVKEKWKKENVIVIELKEDEGLRIEA